MDTNKLEKGIRKVNAVTEFIALRVLAFIFALISCAVLISLLNPVHAEELTFGKELSKHPLVLPPLPVKEKGLDLDKLAKAVARHETNDCNAKAGAAKVRNCFGIREWKNG